MFNYCHIFEFFGDFFKTLSPDFRVEVLTPTETNPHTHLHTVLNPLPRILHFETQMMIVRLRAELDFLNFDLLLLLAGFALALLLVVLELTEVHNTTNWRICARCNFYEIKLTLFGFFQRLCKRNNADIGGFVAVLLNNEADFTRTDLTIDAIFTTGRYG